MAIATQEGREISGKWMAYIDSGREAEQDREKSGGIKGDVRENEDLLTMRLLSICREIRASTLALPLA